MFFFFKKKKFTLHNNELMSNRKAHASLQSYEPQKREKNAN